MLPETLPGNLRLVRPDDRIFAAGFQNPGPAAFSPAARTVTVTTVSPPKINAQGEVCRVSSFSPVSPHYFIFYNIKKPWKIIGFRRKSMVFGYAFIYCAHARASSMLSAPRIFKINSVCFFAWLVSIYLNVSRIYLGVWSIL